MKDHLGILILSCDKNSDLWEPYFSLFWKNYNGLHQVYLGCNKVKYQGSKVKVIYSGEDLDWSTSCRTILKQIPNKYILLLLEDLFITTKIDLVEINKHIKFIENNKAKHVHIVPNPNPDNFLNQEIGMYEKGAPYRVNVVGYWDKEYLLSLLMDGESPWDFEIKGSYRTINEEGFYCLKKPLFSVIHVLEKGSWLPEAVQYCKEQEVYLEIEKREMLSRLTNLKSILQVFYFNLMIKVPWKIRVRIMDILRKLLISY
tara:strand:- start:5042 stop:5815 length:774 start_codon:yes stop_codon:yes gene_type:complete